MATDARVKKRTSNACQRCRGQKIKCSGTEPCTKCAKRGVTCIFDDSNSKVLVSKEYLSALHKKVSNLEEGATPAPSGHTIGRNGEDAVVLEVQSSLNILGSESQSRGSEGGEMMPRSSPGGQTSRRNTQVSSARSPDTPLATDYHIPITNPLSAGPSGAGFISHASLACPVYLGTSSNWSFSRKVLNAAHQSVYQTPLGPESFMLDGAAYSLGWNGLRTTDGDEKLPLPSLTHALYLVNTVHFHIGEVYHLYDETTFLQALHQFYENRDAWKSTLWYIHYLLIMAFGKALVTRNIQDNRAPGAEFFVAAMKLLPDVSQLWTDPFTVAEIFCCTALYLQSVDFRYGAYLTIGHGMRTALFQGMHTDLPIETFGAATVERARRIWWTVYILDRELSSLMGLPVQITDEIISAELPSYQLTAQISATNIHIKLCRTIAQVLRTVYGPDGRLDKRFLTNTKSSLTSMAEIADELNTSFGLPTDNSVEGISRLSATLHLSYHQCVILTTRPLMFSLFKQRLSPQPASRSYTASLERLHVLLQMCVDSALQSLTILSSLQDQGLLQSLIPFDLESVFCAGVITLMASLVNKVLINDFFATMRSTYRILDGLIAEGNMIACHRKAEIEQLSDMLDRIGPSGQPYPQMPTASALIPASFGNLMHPNQENNLQDDGAMRYNDAFEDWTWQDTMSSTQLMNVVGALDLDHFDWSGDPFSI